jgi:hypothetical protein
VVRQAVREICRSPSSFDPPGGCRTRSAGEKGRQTLPDGRRVGSMKRQAETSAGTLMGSSLASREPNSAQWADVGLRRFSSAQELPLKARSRG